MFGALQAIGVVAIVAVTIILGMWVHKWNMKRGWKIAIVAAFPLVCFFLWSAVVTAIQANETQHQQELQKLREELGAAPVTTIQQPQPKQAAVVPQQHASTPPPAPPQVVIAPQGEVVDQVARQHILNLESRGDTLAVESLPGSGNGPIASEDRSFAMSAFDTDAECADYVYTHQYRYLVGRSAAIPDDAAARQLASGWCAGKWGNRRAVGADKDFKVTRPLKNGRTAPDDGGTP